MDTIYLVDSRIFYAACGLIAIGFLLIFQIGACARKVIEALKDK